MEQTYELTSDNEWLRLSTSRLCCQHMSNWNWPVDHCYSCWQCLTVTNTKHMLAKTHMLLYRLFEMKKEDPDWLMNFQLIDNCKCHTITISQTKYIDTLLKQHQMESCTLVSTPMEASLLFTRKDCPSIDNEKAEMAQYPYREVLSIVTWLAIISHPNLVFVTSYLGQYSTNPGKSHWKTLFHVLWYL